MSDLKTIDLSNVKRSARDGRLMGTSFEVSICESCDAVHFDLHDRAGKLDAFSRSGGILAEVATVVSDHKGLQS